MISNQAPHLFQSEDRKEEMKEASMQERKTAVCSKY
jgi:hypothetical protein